MDIQKVLCDRQIISSKPDMMIGIPMFVREQTLLQTFFDYLKV